MEKIIDKKRSIGDVADELGLETHVIRFWESKFPQIKPQIGKGARRYYFDHEVAVLAKIKSLLHDEGYSISGLQKLLAKRKKSDEKEQNVEFLIQEDSKDEKFSLDDFINPNVEIVKDLEVSQRDLVNKIILKIESNLNKL